MTEASHIAEFVRAKLAAGNLPVLQSFAPTVTITSTPEHMNELDTGQRALAEALQALQAEWQRSMQQVAADARAAALAELPANMDRPRKPSLASEVRQAKRVGLDVRAATIGHDGTISLRFAAKGNGESDDSEDLRNLI
jgi:hypothetical protein